MAPPHDQLYCSLPRITTIVRQRCLRLAGHVVRHAEAANKVLLWKPDGPRRRGRPTTTKHTREKHEPQRDKSNSGNEEPKPLERNHHVTTLSG